MTIETTAMLLGGFVLLVLGAEFLVRGASRLAGALGISPLVIGLTVVAYGTSAPELSVSLQAALAGNADIAVVNVVGSNICNTLWIIGASSLVTPGGLNVAPSLLNFDMEVMVAAALACLPIFFTGCAIARWEGWLFLGGYAAYTTYLIMDATGHDALPVFSNTLLMFVLPLTAVTVAVVTVRAVRRQRGQACSADQ